MTNIGGWLTCRIPSKKPLYRHKLFAWIFIIYSKRNFYGLIQALLERRKVITAPIIADALPPSSSHRVLFVGAPVKARDTLELTESDALQP
jgi:hypothetical protein